jgi:hypothetical protein
METEGDTTGPGAGGESEEKSRLDPDGDGTPAEAPLPDEVPALAPAAPMCIDEPLFADADSDAAPARSPP